jgi:hypothetical protein
MNNEPVAWMDEINTFVLDEDYKQFPKSLQNGMIPLYTHPVNPKYDPETGEPLIDGYPLFSGLPHPVKDKPHPKCDEACMYLCQMRELTDEEITEIFDTTFEVRDYEDSFIKFARAILRKAQEK